MSMVVSGGATSGWGAASGGGLGSGLGILLPGADYIIVAFKANSLANLGIMIMPCDSADARRA